MSGLEHIGKAADETPVEYYQRKARLYASGAPSEAIETPEQLRRRAASDDERRRADAANAKAKSNDRFASARLFEIPRRPENESALDAAIGVVNSDFALGMGVYGDGGTGKTTITTAIVNEARISRKAARSISALELMLRFQAVYTPDDASSSLKLLNEFAEIPVLAIQDLGKEPFTGFSVTMLHGLMDLRWSRKRPLIVTCNLSEREMILHYSATPPRGEKLDPHMGPTMMDRVRDMTGSPWTRIDGVSLRGEA